MLKQDTGKLQLFVDTSDLYQSSVNCFYWIRVVSHQSSSATAMGAIDGVVIRQLLFISGRFLGLPDIPHKRESGINVVFSLLFG